MIQLRTTLVRSIGFWLLVLVSAYLWVYVPIIELMLIPALGYREAKSIAWVLGSFGVVHPHFDEQAIAGWNWLWYCLDRASPLLMFLIALAVTVRLRFRWQWATVWWLCGAVFGAGLIKAVWQRSEFDALMVLAGITAVSIGSRAELRRPQPSRQLEASTAMTVLGIAGANLAMLSLVGASSLFLLLVRLCRDAPWAITSLTAHSLWLVLVTGFAGCSVYAGCLWNRRYWEAGALLTTLAILVLCLLMWSVGTQVGRHVLILAVPPLAQTASLRSGASQPWMLLKWGGTTAFDLFTK